MSSSKKRGRYRRVRRDFLSTLFARMLAAYLSVAFFLILAVGLTVTALVHKQIKRQSEAELSALSTALCANMEALNGSETTATDETESDKTAESATEASDAAELLSAAAESALSFTAAATDCAVHVFPREGAPASFYGSGAEWQALSRAALPDYATLAVCPDGATVENLLFQQSDGVQTDTVSVKKTMSLYGEDCFIIVSFKEASFSDTMASCRMEILLMMLLALLICVIAVYASTERMLEPFMRINSIVQRYSKGDFNVRIPLTGADEATQLARSFNTMADQLNDLEETRKSFVANVSHELRSPLTSIRGFLEAMHDGTIPAEEYDKYIDIVLSETKRMTVMVNDLLDLARIESGKTAIHLEIFDINELIRRTLITFEARIRDNRMDVEVKFAQEQYHVEADSAQISQVLRNLIDNAIKYTPEGGRLRLATYAVRREVYVVVQDSGQGIPEEDIPHLFDRFYKVEKAHTPTKQSGTGLGLSIVKKIIDRHGQTISVQSSKGKGTSFTFTLKRVAPATKRQAVIPDGGMKNGI